MRNKKEYSPDWKDIIRPLMLKLKGYKCEICKVKHKSIGYYDYKGIWIECDNYMIDWSKKNDFKIVTQYLHVHHINGNKKCNEEWNLKVLCQRCHLAEERELNKLKKKLKGIIYKK